MIRDRWNELYSALQTLDPTDIKAVENLVLKQRALAEFEQMIVGEDNKWVN